MKLTPVIILLLTSTTWASGSQKPVLVCACQGDACSQISVYLNSSSPSENGEVLSLKMVKSTLAEPSEVKPIEYLVEQSRLEFDRGLQGKNIVLNSLTAKSAMFGGATSGVSASLIDRGPEQTSVFVESSSEGMTVTQVKCAD